MATTAAELIAQHLVDQSAAVRPGKPGDWVVYVGRMPDTPDNALCIYDTEGTIDGRLQGAGTVIRHPGYQVRVRAQSYKAAKDKLEAVLLLLDAIKATTITFDGSGYVVAGCHRTSGNADLGMDADKRHSFTSNGRTTFKGA